ncbi:MAG: repressor LexA [Gemmatimonadetes bacterium]|nr:repressor LexA [Gemmatimonadota bacterium]
MGRTPRGETRAKILEYMRRRILGGDPPTVREVQRAFGFRAVESARAHMSALVREGHLLQSPGLSRGYRLPGDWGRSAMVPLLGRVQAGGLSEAIEDPEGYLSVQHSFSPEELFALRVRGRSMIGVGILPGDLVIVRRQATARAGEVVVALVGDEATVKTLHFREGRAILRPENPEFEPIEPEPDELKILGRVIEVRRFLVPCDRDFLRNSPVPVAARGVAPPRRRPHRASSSRLASDDETSTTYARNHGHRGPGEGSAKS